MKAILEQIEHSDEHCVHAFIYHKESFVSPWHFHPEFELTFIKKSKGIRYVGDSVQEFEEGDLVLLGSNLPHCWKNHPDHCGESESLVIQWNKEVIGSLPIFSRIHEMLNLAKRGMCIRSEKKEEITLLMHKVQNESAVQQYLSFIELLQMISETSDFQVLAGASYEYDLSTETITRLDIIQTFVKENFREKISLATAAQKLSMSEQAFSRFFSKTMNRPFFVFLNEYRINMASRMILDTDLQMAEVAYQCGFDSLPFFYKQFKKFKKYSPLEFRKMYQRL